MCLNPFRGKRGDNWATRPKCSGTVLNQQPPNFGQYGMPKNMFEKIDQCLRLSKYAFTNVLTQDPWVPIRGFIEAFNQRRINYIDRSD